MSDSLKKLTEAAARSAGRRYCSTHGSEVDASSGSKIRRGKTMRWVCFTCQDRRDLIVRAPAETK
jgi:hypothetical protein